MSFGFVALFTNAALFTSIELGINVHHFGFNRFHGQALYLTGFTLSRINRL